MKTKTAKRIAAFAAALSLSACMMSMPAGTAWAAVHTITITDGSGAGAPTSGHTFKAYRVFSGTAETEGSKVVLKNPAFDSNAFDRSGLINALTANDSPVKNAFSGISISSSDADIAAAFENLDNAAAADKTALSRILSKYIKTETAASQSGENGIIKVSDDGYYFIVDTSGEGGYSSFILRVAGGDISVPIKTSTPEVIKKVEENTTVTGYDGMGETAGNNNFNDVADYCMGESVNFKLYGTMPSNLADYPAYYYKFSDTLSAGLDLPESIKVVAGNKTITFNKAANTNDYTPTDSNEKNCRVAVASANGKNTITISFEDIKAYGGVTKDTIVTVEYASKLNSSAVIGLDGNLNTVRLSYLNNPGLDYRPNTTDNKKDGPRFEDDSNNPTPDNPYDDTYKAPDSDGPDNPNSPDPNGPYNDTDKPDVPGTPNVNNNNPNANEDNNNPYTSTSTEDKVIVFTYELDITKADAKTHTDKLGGAKFTLRKRNGNIDGDYAVFGANGVITDWLSETDYNSPNPSQTLIEKKANTVITSSAVPNHVGEIIIKGLDDGEYTLEETAPPSTYNTLSGDDAKLKFKIDATTANSQNWNGAPESALTGLRITRSKTGACLPNDISDADADNSNILVKAGNTSGNPAKLDGTIDIEIYNTKGATLPSTGGMGTTVFLVSGGIAAGAAAIVYISRKRTEASEN